LLNQSINPASREGREGDKNADAIFSIATMKDVSPLAEMLHKGKASADI